MPIVKILKSSQTFAAIKYNEERCSKGEAKLIAERNFESFLSLFSHQDYLKIWSDKNKRIKNSQFHATISLKENELSQDELISLADKWMQLMGYGDNPYLIYYHCNTSHPHIHIVSSRIDKNGKKINDSFEHERAVKCLNKILGIDTKDSNRKILSDLLKYSFTTKYQFIELCNQSGFKVNVNDENLICTKGDSKVTISNELIDFCINRYHKEINISDKKRIQGLIYKYAALLSKDNFAKFMKDKFGLNFIFYGKKGDINGYTVIDNNKRCVYKGSELFGAKKLSELLAIEQSPVIDLILDIDDYIKDNPLCTSYEINNTVLRNSSFELRGDKLYSLDDKTEHPLDQKIFDKLSYNNRLNYFYIKFNPHNEKTAKLVARLAQVKWQDLLKLSSSNISDVHLCRYKSIIEETLKTNSSLVSALKNSNLILSIDHSDFYILDPVNKIVVCGEELGLDKKDILENVRSFNSSALDLGDFNDFNNSLNEGFDLLDLPSFEFSDLIYIGHYGSEKNRKKKRKKII